MERQREIPAFLYKAVNNDLVVYDGMVRLAYADVGVFYTDGKPARRIQVSAKEGEVRNNAVWLTEKDEAAAAEILIQSFNHQIDQHTEKIQKLRVQINEMSKHIKVYR